MKIDNPDLFAVVIPTFEGTRFLKRTLDYFRNLAFEGRLVLADNSSGAHRQFVDSCAVQYPELWVEVFSFPEEIRFLDKMVAVLEKISSKFVMLHAHDDFMIPSHVEECVDFLDQNPAYSAARGRAIMFALDKLAGPAPAQASVTLIPHPMRAYEQDSVIERVLDHIERYASTFYSIHTRNSLIEGFRATETATKNVIFFQYLSSCLSVLAGKVWCSDRLFYVRQGHEQSWRAKLVRKADYEHWPMLITSPDFSRYYQEFRATLGRHLHSASGVPVDEIGNRIDRAALGMFERSYCQREMDNPEDDAFQKRLNDQNSSENRLLTSIIDFTMKYPDTF